MSRVTAVCSTCGPLYESSDIKADRHRTNAVTKAQRIAIEHTDAEPHEVVVDPGDALERTVVGKVPKSQLDLAVAYADEVLNNTPFITNTTPKEYAVKILADIKAAILTAWATGYMHGRSGR